MSAEPKPTGRARPQGGAGGAPARAAAPRTGPAGTHRWAVAAFLLAALALWEVGSRFAPPILIPSPARVATRFVSMWGDPGFLQFAWQSVLHVAAVVALAFTFGVAIALLGHFSAMFRPGIYHRVAPFLNSFSTLGWAFLAMIWFGLNDQAVIFASTLALLPIAIINSGAGLRELDRETLEMATSYSRNRYRQLVRVILPMLVPYLFATLRLCVGIAWQIVLTVELLCGSSGLGTIINLARARYATDMLFAVVALILIIVFITDRVIFANIHRRLRKTYGV